MGNLWLLLIVLACPLMMIFMMRGMGKAKTGTDDATEPLRAKTLPALGDQRRIAQLEREVAGLRAVNHDKSENHRSRPAGRYGRSR